MKRTKENWKDPQPRDRNGISGLFQFDGEDRGYLDRQNEHKAAQRQWIEEQKREKQARIEKEREEEKNFARQTLQTNRTLGIVDGQVERMKKMMQESVKDANLQLRTEKEAKEKYERELRIQEELADLQYQKDIRKKGAY